MDTFGDLPTWVVLLLGILCAAILMMLNLGWLLSVKAMVDRQRRTRNSAPEAPTADPEDSGRNSER